MDQQKQVEVTNEQEKPLAPVTIPPLPKWPTSRPGPQVTEPPPGTKRVALRTEQVVEIAYDQERGKSALPATERTSTS